MVCNNTYSRSGMSKHIQGHVNHIEKKDTPQKPGNCFIIKVTDEDGMFWLYLEIPKNRTLVSLDKFFRKRWMECCGHMSAFTINDLTCYSTTYGEHDKSMNIKLDKLLYPGAQFGYEYDFGSTTFLKLQIIAANVPPFSKKQNKITVIAKHDAIEFNCFVCGSEASFICTYCDMWDGAVLCKKCLDKHECGLDGALSVAQSPRAGICGYQ